jgi:methyl-accepting chemotaxis protein
MSITNLFDKIAGRQQQREKARIDDFRGLVRAIAEGKEPDADRVDTVLHDAGRTLDDLRSAVERLQKRRAMKAQLDTMPKLEAEKADLEAKIGKAAEVLSAAEAKFTETVNPLRWRLDAIKSELHQTWSLTQALVESCPYPELAERARQIDQARTETHDEATRLHREIEEHVKAISQYKSQAEMSTFRPHQAEYLDRAKHRENRLAETHAKVKETLKRAEDLEKQEAAIREQMLVP